jgi:hypothetical protein
VRLKARLKGCPSLNLISAGINASQPHFHLQKLIFPRIIIKYTQIHIFIYPNLSTKSRLIFNVTSTSQRVLIPVPSSPPKFADYNSGRSTPGKTSKSSRIYLWPETRIYLRSKAEGQTSHGNERRRLKTQRPRKGLDKARRRCKQHGLLRYDEARTVEADESSGAHSCSKLNNQEEKREKVGTFVGNDSEGVSSQRGGDWRLGNALHYRTPSHALFCYLSC